MWNVGRVACLASCALLLLAGCGNDGTRASSAAGVGATQVPLQEITDQLQAINGVLGEPLDAAAVSMTNAIVRNNVVYELVEQTAAAAGVSVTDAQVQELLANQYQYAGGQEPLQQQAAQAGIAPELIETDMRVTLLVSELANELSGGQALDRDALTKLVFDQVLRTSEQVGVTINPRFGAWEAKSLSIVPDPDAPSVPAQALPALPGLP